MCYNIQYVVFIVVYIIVKLQFYIKLWHILFKRHNPIFSHHIMNNCCNITLLTIYASVDL